MAIDVEPRHLTLDAELRAGLRRAIDAKVRETANYDEFEAKEARLRTGPRTRDSGTLTKKQAEVLERLGRGMSMSAIADELGLTAPAVWNRRENGIQRLGATSTAHAIRIARHMKLL